MDRPLALADFQIDAFASGELTRRWIHLFDLDGFGAVEIPIVVVAGQRPSPLLFAVAGVHGNEYEGMEAIRQVTAELDPRTMQGSFVAIVTANPFAYASRTRESPEALDGLNLARDLVPYGILVNDVAPGATGTENILEAIRRRELTNGQIAGRIPLRRRAA